MKTENENCYLDYFFKKSILGMVLYVRVTSKEDKRQSTVLRCTEEQAQNFLTRMYKKL